ncbi:MAG TPA: hypothetical protein VLE97_08685 [Gaiellaceae bacterium]|nr:hypothetical protein [Gaiellaceae bacterium]
MTKPAEKILETVGTLQLIDTGRRCSTRGFRILRVHCTAGCGGDPLHDGMLEPYWSTVKRTKGYHQGCDPKSIWKKDPVAARLQQSLMHTSLMGPPPDACLACGQLDCGGAEKGKQRA